jgi:hypothetical protein
VRLEVPRENAEPGSNRIEFTVQAVPEGGGEPVTIVEKTTFLVQ